MRTRIGLVSIIDSYVYFELWVVGHSFMGHLFFIYSFYLDVIFLYNKLSHV